MAAGCAEEEFVELALAEIGDEGGERWHSLFRGGARRQDAAGTGRREACRQPAGQKIVFNLSFEKKMI